jgi:tryptophan-rich sensory protein
VRNIRASKTIKLIFAILACQIAGVVGSIFTAPSIPRWYATLRKADFSPPNWVFVPVWTFLFVLMAVSAYLVWNKGLENKNVKMAVLTFSIQLVLNMLWSFLFFRLQCPLYAFFEIIVLWLAIVLTILNFFKISRRAGWLLIPYITWVSFAAILNFSMVRLNR